MAKVPVLINRSGGAAAADRDIGYKVADALAGANVDAEVELIGGGDCGVRCRALTERSEPLVVVGGGDGTIGAAASALVGTDTALGILPLGTLNHFARDLGIPTALDQAAALIAAGKAKRVDVAEMNGRIFVNNSAIGLYPLLVVDREIQRVRLGRPKAVAMAIASVRTLVRFSRQRLTLTVNEREGGIDTPLLFVGNNDYRIDLPAVGTRDTLESGQLFVVAMRTTTRLGFIAAGVRALLGRSRAEDMARIEGVERLRVSSRRSQLAVSLDGEVLRAAPPLDYAIRKQALRVIAP